MVKVKEVNGLLVDIGKCALCDKGNMILRKSTFEQYQPSVYECENCKNEVSLAQMNKAETMNLLQGEREFFLDREATANVIAEYYNKNSLLYDGCKGLSDTLNAKLKELLYAK